jgi:hypothetical protein
VNPRAGVGFPAGRLSLGRPPNEVASIDIEMRNTVERARIRNNAATCLWSLRCATTGEVSVTCFESSHSLAPCPPSRNFVLRDAPWPTFNPAFTGNPAPGVGIIYSSNTDPPWRTQTTPP